jgi:hypothetical protein
MDCFVVRLRWTPRKDNKKYFFNRLTRPLFGVLLFPLPQGEGMKGRVFQTEVFRVSATLSQPSPLKREGISIHISLKSITIT